MATKKSLDLPSRIQKEDALEIQLIRTRSAHATEAAKRAELEAFFLKQEAEQLVKEQDQAVRAFWEKYSLTERDRVDLNSLVISREGLSDVASSGDSSRSLA